MKTCSKCKINKPFTSEYYPKCTTSKSGLKSYCKSCSNRMPSRIKAKNKRRKTKYEQLKILLVEYKGNHCQICKYNKCLAALTFHHQDPSQKDFTIANYMKKGYITLDRLKKEADKCILVCANCHTEIHQGLHSEV